MKKILPTFILRLVLFHVLVQCCSLTTAHSETLQLGVSHSEYLPPAQTLQSRVALPAHYQTSSFSSSTSSDAASQTLKAETAQTLITKPRLPQAPPAPPPAPPLAVRTAAPTLNNPIIEWFPIPTPMAGVWTKRGDTTLSVTDLRTGVSQPLNEWTEDEMTVTWGHQTDKLGNVWHANLLPAERDGISAGKSVKFLTVSQKLEGTAPDALVTRTHYLVSESYGRTAQQSDIFQQEALNHYQLVASGGLLNNSTNRVFTYAGQAVRDGMLVSTFQKVGTFNPTTVMNGIDLTQSLNEYLHSINRADLVR